MASPPVAIATVGIVDNRTFINVFMVKKLYKYSKIILNAIIKKKNILFLLERFLFQQHLFE